MKEFIHVIRITGDLVKNELSEFKNKKGIDAIGGVLTLRTEDGSEHEVNFYSDKYKTDESGNVTSEEKYFYKEYKKYMDMLRDLTNCKEGERPDVISITDGTFRFNPFKSKKTNKVFESNKINARFINVEDPKDYDSVEKMATFEIEGMVDSIQEEMKNDVLTGNLIVNINVISQIQRDYKKEDSYEVSSIFPVKTIVDKSIAGAFREAGYYEGCFSKFVGTIVNMAETDTIVEKQNFGQDIVKKVTRNIRKNELKSASEVLTIYDKELTDDIIDALKEKKKQVLEEVKLDKSKTAEGFTADKSTPAPSTNYNPFK